MSTHTLTIVWARGDAAFVDNRYSRVHEWRFDGGAKVRASASPTVVPAPLSDPAAVDPEEAFIASIASCHMLWFLYLAAQRGFIVDSYVDAAQGTLARDASGRTAITRVALRPQIVFGGDNPPEPHALDEIHHEAHEKCFIANSVKTEIVIEQPEAAARR